ncbi:MAG TPA: hypothetical protein VN017_04530 [Pseudoxanthomonas sp.]|nr:hypothetical protein [Pseudoxanthomonas sp.]
MGVDDWIAVALVNALLGFVLVVYLLKAARPTRRVHLYGGMIFFSLVALMFFAGIYNGFNEGWVPQRHGKRVFHCMNPGAFWSWMVFYDLALVATVAFVASCAIRYRRPYRKGRKNSEMVE